MGLDLNFDYKKIKEDISATQAYNELKEDYKKVIRTKGEAFEEKKAKQVENFNKLKDKAKKFKKDLKNQYEHLIDVFNQIKGSGNNSTSFLKKILLKVIKNIEPSLSDLLYEEAINAIGCDQQQTFNGNQVLYIKVSSIDLFGLLKLDPSSDIGSISYEINTTTVQDIPFSMNRALYDLIQNENTPFSSLYGSAYKGLSGQDLFDIEYTTTSPFGSGDWFKVTLSQRLNNANTISQFIIDYYKSIKIVDFENILAKIMNQISGAISIGLGAGSEEIQIDKQFSLFIQRVLGICIDNDTEIDVSGTAKIPEVDAIDESFFELDDLDLRNIQLQIDNIKNGVVQYEDCDNVSLPVDFVAVIQALNNIRFVPDNEKVDAANKLTDSLTNNPGWKIPNIDLAVNGDFLKNMIQGVALAVLSPKVLLPIITMLVSLGQQFLGLINKLGEFLKNFKKFIFNLISKIGALFIKELVETIKRDIKILVQRIIQDVSNEKVKKITNIILKLIQILLIFINLISDFRKCKSIIDELLQLLSIGGSAAKDLLSRLTSQIPLPLLFASEFLDGYSESRAFVGVIKEFQKMGIPTGALPDGSPNLTILSFFGQMKANEKERSENGKIQVAIKPTAVTPAGLTIPTSASGISL
jgi:hypothetical protein